MSVPDDHAPAEDPADDQIAVSVDDPTADPDTPADQPPPPPPPAVHAVGLSGTGPEGRAFGPVDLTVPAGGLHVLEGAPGSGRTSLLLALAGRFTPVTGELTVYGRTGAAAIRQISAIAGFADIDEVDDGVRVRAVLAEQLAWQTPWYRWAPKPDLAHLAAVCGPVFGDKPLPDLGARVGDLPEVDRMLLRIALALTDEPALLIIDDLEQVRSRPDQRVLATRLIDLAAGRTIIATVINPLPRDIGPHHRYPAATVAPAPAAHKER